MDDKKYYYAIIDVDRIQSFIFESSKLTHIIGGSRLISYLTSFGFCENNKLLEKSNQANSIDELSEKKFWFEIYFGGGNMKLFFNSRDKAESFLRNYQLKFNVEVDSASFTSIIYEISSNDYGNFKKELEEAEKELKKIKLGKEIAISNYANPIFEVCPVCKKRNSEKSYELYNPKDNKKIFVCKDCKSREDAYRNKDKKFNELNIIELENKFSEDFMNNFERIRDDGSSYIGVVTIDGNEFGEKIRNLFKREDKKGFKETERMMKYLSILKDFSNDINSGVSSVILELLREEKYLTLLRKDGEILFRPIILGGDDICFVIKGEVAISFTQDLLKRLERRFENYKLNFAAGISIVKSSFPFYIAHQLSESLLANAKKETRKKSALDFEIINTTSVENLSELRKNKYYYEKDGSSKNIFTTTMRPFVVDDEKNIYKKKWRSFSMLISILKGLQNHNLLARNKIKALREISRLGKRTSEYEFEKLIARLGKENINKIRKRLERIYERNSIWVEDEGILYNNFIDIAELNEFYNKNRKNNNDNGGKKNGNKI